MGGSDLHDLLGCRVRVCGSEVFSLTWGKETADMLEPVFVALLLCLTVVIWSILYARRRAGRAWVAYEPRSHVPWGLLDVFLALGLLVVLTSVALAALGVEATDQLDETPRRTDADLQAAGILAQSLVSLAVVAFSISAMRVRYRATGSDLGWSTAKIGSDVRLGVVAFLALAPPVYAMQMYLVQWFESKHPLIELIRRNPQPNLIAVCIVSAVWVAPVVEEYLFRGLLQGWLERLADGRDNSLGAPVAYWPIAISAFSFAILHWSHGPDWIPLFFLAVGLGYLYRQTHRLLPVIVVHFLLNACSMTIFLVS
jgi:membrane protease YdiL (CAAX protease family)